MTTPPNKTDKLKFRLFLNNLPIETDVEVAIYERVEMLITTALKQQLKDKAQYKIDELSLVPSTPGVDIAKYKVKRKTEILSALKDIEETL